MIKNKLSKLIDRYQESMNEEARTYIGASSIGSDCYRQIWYAFKGIKGDPLTPKTRRTFEIGKTLEGLIIEWLIKAGVKVDKDSKTYISKNVPIFQGHFDGIILSGTNKVILEVKTAKDASFKLFVNKGVKVWNANYYAQVQSYMGMSGINSTSVLVLNKDNSELSDEMVSFDENYYLKLEDKASLISSATIEPPKISNSPLWFQCKMCRYKSICHG